MSTATTVKERPILFSGGMVKALLAGRKTQTRRVVKPQPPSDAERAGPNSYEGPEGPAWFWWKGHGWDEMKFWPPTTRDGVKPIHCPHGRPGDRLWAREGFGISEDPTGWEGHHWLIYNADGATIEVDCAEFQMGRLKAGKRYPSIHMPRWASRITLEITGVRVERLQDISEADAEAEGLVASANYSACDHFARLWDSINGSGAWAANPWCWVLKFRRVEGGRT